MTPTFTALDDAERATNGLVRAVLKVVGDRSTARLVGHLFDRHTPLDQRAHVGRLLRDADAAGLPAVEVRKALLSRARRLVQDHPFEMTQDRRAALLARLQPRRRTPR